MLGKKTSNRGRNPLVWLAPPRRASRGASEAAVLCYCSIASFVAIAIIAQKFLHRLQLQLTSLRTYLYGLVLNLIENA